MNDLELAHLQFVKQGYDVIPLKPLSKDPFANAWQRRPALLQWENAPSDSNIGLRAGRGKAFIDCDEKNEPGTFSNVTHWLNGLGITNYPVVQTASGIGRHIYVNFAGQLWGNYKKLTIGAGEFRYGPGSQVAAPPSVVPNGEYRLISGDFELRPSLDLKDLAQIIAINEAQKQVRPPRMTPLAEALAEGRTMEGHENRSDAEGALVLSMINSGFDYEGIKRVFESFPCAGKYREKKARDPKEGERYLYLTYTNMLAYSQTHESPMRRKLKALLEAAEAAPWKRVTDRNVFIAHVQRAYRAGKPVYPASVRDLALDAGIGFKTVSRANQRLIKQHLLELSIGWKGLLANVYTIPEVDKTTHYLSSLPVRQCVTLSTTDIATHDAFRNGKGRLGQRAGQVYAALMAEPLTGHDLLDRVGGTRKTLKRALKRLLSVKDYATGEILRLVEFDGEQWRAVPYELDYIAGVLRTHGARGRQAEQYRDEREKHRTDLEVGALRRARKRGND